MSEFNVSTRYASALLQSASENNSFDVVSEEMDLVEKTFSQSAELSRVIASPIIESAKKISIIEAVFEEKVSSEALNFLKFILMKNRDKVFYDIIKRFLELRDIKLGIVNMNIISAIELPEEEKRKMISKFEDYSGKKIRAAFNVDENIIGGFLVRIGDTVVDASVTHQLQQLKKRLKSAALQ